MVMDMALGMDMIMGLETILGGLILDIRMMMLLLPRIRQWKKTTVVLPTTTIFGVSSSVLLPATTTSPLATLPRRYGIPPSMKHPTMSTICSLTPMTFGATTITTIITTTTIIPLTNHRNSHSPTKTSIPSCAPPTHPPKSVSAIREDLSYSSETTMTAPTTFKSVSYPGCWGIAIRESRGCTRGYRRCTIGSRGAFAGIAGTCRSGLIVRG
mmetsp:Transcript_10469/g.21481  ORF Transcript_10469/g.21481 Transcript_10469/m.21481 type:complete len:212 (-) Transcript_10469:444-1079(-)